MTHVTCRLTAKNRDQLRNRTLGNRVWASFTFFSWAGSFSRVNGSIWTGATTNKLGQTSDGISDRHIGRRQRDVSYISIVLCVETIHVLCAEGCGGRRAQLMHHNNRYYSLRCLTYHAQYIACQ